MKAFKEVKAGDTLYRVCFSDYSIEMLTVRGVGKSKYDNTTLIHYSRTETHCSIIEEEFFLEAYEEDLGKCWLHDTLSYAICTDYDAVDVAIRENSASRSKPKKGRRR